MRKVFTILVAFVLLSCQEKQNKLQIVTLNKQLFSFSYNSKKDTIIRVCYKVINPTNNKYYVNNIIRDKNLNTKSAYKGGRFLRIFNLRTKNEVTYFTIPFFWNEKEKVCAQESLNNILIDSKRLGYKVPKEYFYSKEGCPNFFIHPNETIYFEYYINLTDTIANENFRGGYADLKKGINYYAKLSIASDSTNYKNDLPRDVLKTIEENNFMVYHGMIESKNKVSVKVLD